MLTCHHVSVSLCNTRVVCACHSYILGFLALLCIAFLCHYCILNSNLKSYLKDKKSTATKLLQYSYLSSPWPDAWHGNILLLNHNQHQSFRSLRLLPLKMHLSRFYCYPPFSWNRSPSQTHPLEVVPHTPPIKLIANCFLFRMWLSLK